MADLDALIEELRNDGREDDATELEKLRGSNLRKQAGEAEKLRQRAEAAEAKVEKLESAPKRDKAFRDFGIDLDNLTKAERKVLESFDGDLDKEAISEFVEEYELPLAEGSNEEPTDEEPAAARVAAAAKRNPSGRGVTTIKPADANAWSTEKLLRFREQHADEYEALKRGETVTGVPAPA